MNLLEIYDDTIVAKTNLSRKLTLGGITKAYPVYKVRLDQLFYNDQNDRIATWITQYKNDTANTAFSVILPQLKRPKTTLPLLISVSRVLCFRTEELLTVIAVLPAFDCLTQRMKVLNILKQLF